MSSPPKTDGSIPLPQPSSSRPPSSTKSGKDDSTPRSSVDLGYNNNPSSYSQQGEASSSRRPSTSSNHHSPQSIASSSRHFHGPHGADDRKGWQQQSGSAGGSHGLPRITTSSVSRSESGEIEGPRSAPAQGPLKLPQAQVNGVLVGQNQPMRSSSSPDPWTSHSLSSSPQQSPTEHRPNAASPVLGPPFAAGLQRRPSPNDIHNHPLPASSIPPRISSHAADTDRHLASHSSHPSLAETYSGSPTGLTVQSGEHVTPHASRSQHKTRGRGEATQCGQCGQVVHGQFVRAMQKVYHLNCFRCKDCNKVVAQKFFPVEDVEGMYPLCERDYFARLGLICASCDQALRSSYITACSNKYHVEHFTCSECDVLFGPNDSYYEHSGKVYCHYHYSTRFAVKCVGCETAILKQFVEMNRNGRDDCWHPECYMISKFWNVRLASKNFNTPANSALSSAVSLLEMTPSIGPGLTMSQRVVSSVTSLDASPGSEDYLNLTPDELKDKQEAMEMKVQQIWHVLSGYEESSAALIGDMLRAVNGRQLLEIILLAERFILHVETLFAVIDDLEAQFALAGVKGMSHAREAKQLCRKLVNLFSTMSQITPQGGGPPPQELFTLITQLAHYLKILIRIALTGSIKLERYQNNETAMTNTLARLNLLAMDNGDPTVEKRGDFPDPIPFPRPHLSVNDEQALIAPTGGDEEQLKRSIDALTRRPLGFVASTQRIAYGYRSLAPEVTGETTLRGPQGEDFIPPEGCVICRISIEEDCIRLGMFSRWHSICMGCVMCGDKAVVSVKDDGSDEGSNKGGRVEGSLASNPKPQRRSPPRVDEFFYEPGTPSEPPGTILCNIHRSGKCRGGFQSVSRLEQYVFLLHIALRRLYVHFRIHHDLPSVRDRTAEGEFSAIPEVKRMKSVTLDRKLSSTARLPQRSTVVESPAGRVANENGQVVSARSSQAIATLQIPTIRSETGEAGDDNAEPPQSATVDVLRPSFARNNTSVLIINENGPTSSDESDNVLAPDLIQEDDAITLGDIPLLADQTRDRSMRDDQVLLCNLNPLQSLIIKHFALLQLQKTGLGHLIELDEVLELLESRKNQWWNKIFKGNNKKEQKKKGVFGVPIEILVERTGSDSQQGASNVQLRVPEFIEDITLTMRQMDMAVEGIFRKNGNIRRLQQISEALDRDSTSVNLSEENPVQLAALLKRFLREMPDPLLTSRLHKLFCAAASMPNQEDRRRCLHLLMTLLPRYHRDTIEVLFVFLRWVASFSYRDEETGSKMDIANLSTVICPSILYAKGANAARDESFIAIEAVQELMENQDEYYEVPHELRFVINENIFAIFAKELDLPPKEIHRHCSKYMQARGQPQQRVPGSTSTGQVRERPSDPRISVHRSEGNLAGSSDLNGASPYRPPAPAVQSRPTSWVQNSQPGSQNSLHQALNSPSSTSWRGAGPFHGNTSGSRASSRGSAPPSPGPEGETTPRRSFNMDRERSRTPLPHDTTYR